MHHRNPYINSPDFSALARSFPPLEPYVSRSPSGRSTIDFKDPDAQRALTQALLKRDFKLDLALPEDRLCPTVPSRLNYVLWIQDIMLPYNPRATGGRIRGLDIGTGASAIYPLLACSFPSAESWEFTGTEIDPVSLISAQRNVEANGLDDRIVIWPIAAPIPAETDGRTSEDALSPILAPLIEHPRATFDFTMCNPPFYGSASEIESSAEGKKLPPNAVCTGAETEMITPGGETAFVLQMLQESALEDVRGRCRWFTSMLGKLSSVGAIVAELRRRNIDNYALTEFVQGTTRRWAVGWSFGDERLPDTLARPPSASLAAYVPAPTTRHHAFRAPAADASRLHATFAQVLASIAGLAVREVPDAVWALDVRAAEDTWSRAARRKRERTRTQASPALAPAPGEALHCRVSGAPGGAAQVVQAQWVRGRRRVAFEGFWGHVCRRVAEGLAEVTGMC